MNQPMTQSLLASLIDHTLLRPDATERDLARHCQEAQRYGFATVAINSAPTAFCAARLAGSDTGICAAVGFPSGQMTTAAKVFEATDAIKNGATEIDFVINIGALKSGHSQYVENEIGVIVQACEGVTTKVILETCYLTDAEKRAVLKMAIDAGATFVKTSTGRGPAGANLPDVIMLRSLGRHDIKVKAAGGIATLDEVLGYIDAGADRIGTSRALEIMAEAAEVLPE